MVPDDKINEFVKRIREAARSNIESILLFGSAVAGDFHPGLSNLNLNATTSLALGSGLGIYGSADRTSLFSSEQEGLLNSSYFTTSAGATYAHKFGWGNFSGDYSRELGVGSITGQSGTIQGQHYQASAQHGTAKGLQFDTTIHGSNQTVHTVQPLTNKSFSTETSVSSHVAGEFSARLGSEAAHADRFELFRQRRDVARMGVSEAGDGNAGIEIEIGAAIEVGQSRAAAARDGEFREQRDRLHAGRDEFLLFIEEVLRPRWRRSLGLSWHGHVW